MQNGAKNILWLLSNVFFPIISILGDMVSLPKSVFEERRQDENFTIVVENYSIRTCSDGKDARKYENDNGSAVIEFQ